MDISDLFPAVRIILGDMDAVFRRYNDTTLTAGVQTVIKMGKLPNYALTTDNLGITPEPDANTYGLAVYHTAKLFVQARPHGYAFKTRAVSETFGDSSRVLQSIELEIYKMENGTAFGGWQSYWTWLAGMKGLPIWETMSGVEVRTPFQTITVGRNGITVASPGADA